MNMNKKKKGSNFSNKKIYKRSLQDCTLGSGGNLSYWEFLILDRMAELQLILSAEEELLAVDEVANIRFNGLQILEKVVEK